MLIWWWNIFFFLHTSKPLVSLNIYKVLSMTFSELFNIFITTKYCDSLKFIAEIKVPFSLKFFFFFLRLACHFKLRLLNSITWELKTIMHLARLCDDFQFIRRIGISCLKVRKKKKTMPSIILSSSINIGNVCWWKCIWNNFSCSLLTSRCRSLGEKNVFKY